MTPFHFHWCPFVMEYALLLTNCTPCPQQLPASLPIMLKNFNKNYRNNRNISIFTSISYQSVFTRPPFLFFQHNQQCDTLLPIVPCTHKLKAGIAYCRRDRTRVYLDDAVVTDVNCCQRVATRLFLHVFIWSRTLLWPR
jgi:hypothetical protein